MSRILFVEDDPVTAKICQMILEKAGHHVSHAVNGLAAIELLASNSFDLIVTDLIMSQMGGRELCEHIRADDKIASMPILVTTGLEGCESEPWVEELGVSVLLKPIRKNELLEEIDRLSADV